MLLTDDNNVAIIAYDSCEYILAQNTYGGF